MASKPSHHRRRTPASDVDAPALLPRAYVTAHLLLVVAAAVIPFLPVLRNGFVNWDDGTAIVNNPRLVAPEIFRWAFTTSLLGHYQPLTWVAWSALKRSFGDSAAWFHGASVFVHAVNALLVYAVVRQTARFNAFEPASNVRWASLTAALLFAVHPVAVEPIAWVSAFPYLLSLTFLLLSCLAYLEYCRRTLRAKALWFAASCGLYAAALLVREVAIAFPLVLLLMDRWVLGRAENGKSTMRVLAEKLVFVVLAVAGGLMEARAREFATVSDVSVAARASMALSAPFVYLGHILVPRNLSPLDPLPVTPLVDWVRLAGGAIGLVLVLLAMWMLRRRWPAAFTAAMAYLVLIAPLSGWAPSGVQATADRYVYIPGVALAMLAGIMTAKLLSRRPRITAVCVATVVAALAMVSWRQSDVWHDSISLWSRACELDPRNDLATYNLGVSLAEVGRDDEAIARYEQTLGLVPDHALARRNLDLLLANRAEHEAARLATLNHYDAAIEKYGEVLRLDPARVGARAGRGIAWSRQEQWNDAVADLQIAFEQGVSDSEVANSLALALTHLDRDGDAIRVLKSALPHHPDDLNLAHNLARLLVTASPPELRDGALAVRLAREVCARTDNRDPRALDTLSAAYAADGQIDLARAVALRGRAIAHLGGDPEIAALLDARVRSLQR